jgi:hypothetical protein
MLIEAYKSCGEQLSASATECICGEKNPHYISLPLLSLPPEPELELELEPEATPLLLMSPY